MTKRKIVRPSQIRTLISWLFLPVLFFLPPFRGWAQDGPQEQFEKRILAKGLKDPWSIAFGPDRHLWVTESKSYKLLRIEPDKGMVNTVADLSTERRFPRYDNLPDSLQEGKPWPQGGLMGMALHPELLEGKPYIYLSMCMNMKEVKETVTAGILMIKGITLEQKSFAIVIFPATTPWLILK